MSSIPYFDIDAPITVEGVNTDTISENTADAGVTVDGLLIKDSSPRPAAVADPGDAGAIGVTASGECQLVSAGAETRTLAAPTFAGQRLRLVFLTDGGDVVVTVTTTVDQAGNNTLTLADAGDVIELVAITHAAGVRWRTAYNDGVAVATV